MNHLPRQRREIMVLSATVGLLFIFLTASLHFFLQNNRFGVDFYTLWRGSREALIEHVNPYNMETALETQQFVLGRAARPEEDQLAFSYPLYNVFLLAPLAWVPFDWAQPAWLAFNLLLIFIVPWLLFPNHPPLFNLSLLFLFPVSFALIMVFWVQIVLRRSSSVSLQVILGILFAWASSKPQLMVWFILAALLFSLRVKQWAFVASFFTSLFLLLLGSWLLFPGWPFDWLQMVQAYSQYNHVSLIGEQILWAFLPTSITPILIWILYALTLPITGLLFFRWNQGKTTPLTVFCWLGGITYFFHPHGIPYEQIAFLIPFFLWAALQFNLHKKVHWIWWLSILASWVWFGLEQGIKWEYAMEHPPILLYWVWFAWAYRQFPALLAAFSPARSSESLL